MVLKHFLGWTLVPWMSFMVPKHFLGCVLAPWLSYQLVIISDRHSFPPGRKAYGWLTALEGSSCHDEGHVVEFRVAEVHVRISPVGDGSELEASSTLQRHAAFGWPDLATLHLLQVLQLPRVAASSQGTKNETLACGEHLRFRSSQVCQLEVQRWNVLSWSMVFTSQRFEFVFYIFRFLAEGFR